MVPRSQARGPARARQPLREALPMTMDSFRHKPGRGSSVSPAERREIQLTALTECASQEALAERFGRTRSTIRRVLRHPSFEKLKDTMNAELAVEARQVLSSHRTAAARAWAASLERAAQKGDHRPAKDLLLHSGVIEPVSHEGNGPSVIVNIGTMNLNREDKPRLVLDEPLDAAFLLTDEQEGRSDE